jgi:uncharacterized protein YbcI
MNPTPQARSQTTDERPVGVPREWPETSPQPVARALEAVAGREGEAFVDSGSSDLQPQALSGERLLAAISTRIVAILREHYGRGAIKAKTYAVDDIIFVVLRGSGYTPLEKTIMADGGAERVVAMRHDFQRMVAERYKQAIRELTDREVLAFLSQAHVEPDVTIEIFFIDGPLDGLGPSEAPTVALSLGGGVS